MSTWTLAETWNWLVAFVATSAEFHEQPPGGQGVAAGNVVRVYSQLGLAGAPSEAGI